MPLPRDLSWLPGESSAAGEGQVSYPAFVDQWNWAKIHRERSCLDPSQEATFWKLLFWMTQQSHLPRCWSLPEGKADLVVGSLIHYLEVRHQPWEAAFWLECNLTLQLLRKISSMPCCCFVKAIPWQQSLEEKAKQANTLCLRSWPTDVFPSQAGKAAVTKALFIRRTRWSLAPFRNTSFHSFFHPLFHKYQIPFSFRDDLTDTKVNKH